MTSPETDNVRTTQPKILVLGATGGTGRLIVSEALARGYQVTGLVRSPEKAKSLEGAKLIIGDVRDEKALREALKGQDAAISALGTPASPFREVTLLSTATRALVSAMKAEQISRLVSITGIGAGDSARHGGFLFDKLIFPLLLRNVYADKNRQEAIVRNSELDWILVRPSVLNDKPGRGKVRALTDLSGFHGGTIARADVANFVLDQVRDNTWLHRSPLITGENGATASISNSMSSPRTRGPITTGLRGSSTMSPSACHQRHHAVWVPGSALRLPGTTAET